MSGVDDFFKMVGCYWEHPEAGRIGAYRLHVRPSLRAPAYPFSGLTIYELPVGSGTWHATGRVAGELTTLSVDSRDALNTSARDSLAEDGTRAHLEGMCCELELE